MVMRALKWVRGLWVPADFKEEQSFKSEYLCQPNPRHKEACEALRHVLAWKRGRLGAVGRIRMTNMALERGIDEDLIDSAVEYLSQYSNVELDKIEASLNPPKEK